MNKCQNCGNINTAESNFCRFCGTKFLYDQTANSPAPPFDYASPRPYAWKTDEFTTGTEARKTIGGTVQMQHQGRTAPFNPNQPQQLVYQQPQYPTQPYRCPHCGSPYLPRMDRRVSTAGWVTFAVLLVFFFPLFWIGLLIKEDARICPSCLYRVG